MGHYTDGRVWSESAQAWVFEWKPIATAPTDGTTVRLRNEHSGLHDFGKFDRGEWTTEIGNGEMTQWCEMEAR